MKILCLLTITAFTFINSAHAQLNGVLPYSDSIKMEKTVEKVVKELKNSLNQETYRSDEHKRLIIEFSLDTCRIERKFAFRLARQQSTQAMVTATNLARHAYDKLLNKYYRRLLNLLEGEDSEVLKKAQRKWLAFRDSEKQLNRKLGEMQYSGGGTIQHINVASTNLDIVKQRVLDFYHYLLRCAVNL